MGPFVLLGKEAVTLFVSGNLNVFEWTFVYEDF